MPRPAPKPAAAKARAARERAARQQAEELAQAAAAATAEAQRRLTPALAAAGAAAVALAAGAVLGAVAESRPAFGSWPLLVLLAALPAAAAGALAARRMPSTAAGLLAGVAALAPGRLAVDLQLAVDASLAQRPELAVPGGAAAPPSWPGLGLLIAGHLLTIAAGVLAVRASSAMPDDAETPEASYRRVLAGAVAAALVIAVGLVLPPFVSADANLLDRPALDGPLLPMLGMLALGVAAVATVILAMGSQSWGLTRGALIGLAVAAATVALPWLVAALAVPWLHVAVGPFVVLAGAALLAAVPLVPWPRAAGGTELRPSWMYPAAGTMAVLAAGCALAGARAPLFVAAGRTATQAWLIPVGAVIGVLGVALLVPKAAPAVRPAAAVGWVAVVLAGSVVLRPAVIADELAGVQTGSGAIYTMLAVVAALLLAAFATAAGLVDRENAEEPPVGPRLAWPAIAAAILAVGAFAAPVVDGPEYHGSGLAQGVDLAFFGVLAALVVVLGALALAPVSRPKRALAVLAGVLFVIGARLLELPIAGGPAGLGTWLGLACAAVVLAMLAVATAVWRKSAGQ